MGNGKNIQLIKYCQQVKTIVFLVDHEAGIKSGWVKMSGFNDNGTIFKKSLLDQILETHF
jgi:hypothetical protein